MDTKQVAKRILPPLVSDMARAIRNATAYRRYLSKKGMPFSRGYSIVRTKLIMDSLNNGKMLECFRGGEVLPDGHGVGIDERCVEYPWVLSKVNGGTGLLLDAGSALNYDYLLNLPILRSKSIHILTLAPEKEWRWHSGVSYLFNDLRNIPIRGNYYDIIACVSTLEHVGCDNSWSTGRESDNEHRPEDYNGAIHEMCRVLKPGGSLFITVPFGVYSHIGVQQQFDEKMFSRVVEELAEVGEVTECFYRYSGNGWNVARKADCVGCHYVEWSARLWTQGELPNAMPREPDRAVGARAVACVQMIKKSGMGWPSQRAPSSVQ